MKTFELDVALFSCRSVGQREYIISSNEKASAVNCFNGTTSLTRSMNVESDDDFNQRLNNLAVYARYSEKIGVQHGIELTFFDGIEKHFRTCSSDPEFVQTVGSIHDVRRLFGNDSTQLAWVFLQASRLMVPAMLEFHETQV